MAVLAYNGTWAQAAEGVRAAKKKELRWNLELPSMYVFIWIVDDSPSRVPTTFGLSDKLAAAFTETVRVRQPSNVIGVRDWIFSRGISMLC